MPQKENTPNACKIMSVIGLGFSIAGLLCAIFMPLLLKFRSDNGDYISWEVVGAVAGLLLLIGGAFIGGIIGIVMGIIIVIFLLVKQRTKEIALPIAGITTGTAAIIITVLTLALM